MGSSQTQLSMPMPISEDAPLLSREGQNMLFKRESATRRAIRTIEQARVSSQTGTQRQTYHLSEVLNELDQQDRNRLFSIIVALIAILSHFIGGAIILTFLEGWPFIDSFYFCIVTTTTVGYGDITPTRTISKLFVVFYVVISLGIMSAILANVVGNLLDQQEEMILSAMFRQQQQRASGMGDGTSNEDREDQGDGGGDAASRIAQYTKGLNWNDYTALGMSLTWLIVVLIIGMGVFMKMESFSLVDAFYTTMISASTVGFGDLEPRRTITKFVMSFWLIFATIGIVKVIADFTDASVKAKQRAVSRRMLTAQLDVSSWSRMDTDQDGRVDQLEFLSELLVRSGKIEREEIDAIIARFKQLDRDKSGFVNLRDIS